MKKLYTLAIALIGSLSFAQDAVIDKMAIQSCECISNKNLDFSALTAERMELEFGLCFLNSFTTHQEEYSKYAAVDFSDQAAMEKLGETIGLKMIAHCPEIILALSKLGGDDAAAEEVIVHESIDGQLIEILTNEFVTFKVKDKNGRIHNFILLDYFETAPLYTNNQIRQKDNLTVSFSEIELFDPKLKEFRYYKVVTGLQKK